LNSDGVSHQYQRLVYRHAVFALLFFGHIWHGSRTIFRDVFAGVDPDLDEDQIEWGVFQWDAPPQKGSSLKFKHYVKNGKIITLVVPVVKTVLSLLGKL